MNKLKPVWIIFTSLIPLTSLSNNVQAQSIPFVTQPQLPPVITTPALEIQRQVCSENNMGNDPRCQPYYKNPQRQVPRSNTVAPRHRNQLTIQINNLSEKGKRFYAQGDYQKALTTLSEAINLDPNSSDAYIAYLYRSLSYLNLENYPYVIKDANQAIRLNSDSPSTYAIRSVAYYNLNDYQRALEDANRAIRLDPNGIGYLTRSLAYFGLKDYQRALEDANRAIRLDPKSGSPYLHRASVLSALRDYQGALEDANEGIRRDRKFAVAYNNRASFRFALKDYQGALEDANQAIRLDPKVLPAYSLRAISQLALGDRDRALKDADYALNTALNSDSSSSLKTMIAEVQAFNVRGIVRYELGDVDGALSDWDKASDKVTDNGLQQVDSERLALTLLKLAVALYAQGDRQESLRIAQKIQWNRNIADLQYLREKGWGDRLFTDTQTFFKLSQIRAYLAKIR